MKFGMACLSCVCAIILLIAANQIYINGQQFSCTNDPINKPGLQCARLLVIDSELDRWTHDDGLPDWHFHSDMTLNDIVWFNPSWTIEYVISKINQTGGGGYSYSRFLYWYGDTSFSNPLFDYSKTLADYGFSSTKNDLITTPHLIYPTHRHNIGDSCTIPNGASTHYGCRQECTPNDIRLQCVNGVWSLLNTLTNNDICITDWADPYHSAIISTRDECKWIYGFPVYYTCQRLSDMFGPFGWYNYDTWNYQYLTYEEEDGYPTQDDTTYRQLWTTMECHLQPTCQGMADVFGTRDGSWGITPDELKPYWTANCTQANCPTLGTSTGGSCLTCGNLGATPFWLTGTVAEGCAAIAANMTSYPAWWTTPPQLTWYNANC